MLPFWESEELLTKHGGIHRRLRIHLYQSGRKQRGDETAPYRERVTAVQNNKHVILFIH